MDSTSIIELLMVSRTRPTSTSTGRADARGVHHRRCARRLPGEQPAEGDGLAMATPAQVAAATAGCARASAVHLSSVSFRVFQSRRVNGLSARDAEIGADLLRPTAAIRTSVA